MWRSDDGFTLVELLVVLVIVGLMSSIVFVSVSGGLLKSERSRFVHSFLQGLVHTRTASLGRGEEVRFEIDAAERTFSMGGKTLGQIPEIIQIEGDNMVEYGGGRYGIIFFPDGSSTGGAIDIRESGTVVERISIDRLLGLVTTEDVS